IIYSHLISYYFFFNDTSTTDIYTLSLHDALPILKRGKKTCDAILNTGYALDLKPNDLIVYHDDKNNEVKAKVLNLSYYDSFKTRSEEHTSELQSQSNLVCRLLLEKKKKKQNYNII